MPQYLVLPYEDPSDFEGISPGEMQAIIEKYIAWTGRLSAEGRLRGPDRPESQDCRRVQCGGDRHPLSGDTGRPETHALAALLHLQASRLSARTGDDGAVLLLSGQDRSRWDRRRMAQGFRHLERASEGSRITTWHLEAGIAAAHAASPDVAATDWRGILDLYDQLLALNPSPVVALNRVVALAEIAGPEEALRALETIVDPTLRATLLHAATRATLLGRVGRHTEARDSWRAAGRLARTDAEREWIACRGE